MSSAPSCEYVVERSSRGRAHPLSYLVAEPGLAETPPSLLSSRSIPTAISKYYRLALFASRSSAAAPGKPSSSDEERSRAARNDGEVSASNMPTVSHAELVIGLLHLACVSRNACHPARNRSGVPIARRVRRFARCHSRGTRPDCHCVCPRNRSSSATSQSAAIGTPNDFRVC